MYLILYYFVVFIVMAEKIYRNRHCYRNQTLLAVSMIFLEENGQQRLVPTGRLRATRLSIVHNLSVRTCQVRLRPKNGYFL